MSTLRSAVALKSFPLSIDGITVVQIEAGASVEVPARLLDGLTAAGYIATPDLVGADDRRRQASELAGLADGLPWNDFQARATAFLGDATPKKKADIIAALKAAAAPPQPQTGSPAGSDAPPSDEDHPPAVDGS